MNNLLLKNALVFRHCGFEQCDVLIIDGKIARVAGIIKVSGIETVDLAGLAVLPGLVDLHVHLREPGFEYKETIASGTLSAASAGYTEIFSMPNLKPAPDTIMNLKPQLDAIRRDARINVHPYGCITMGQRGDGELVDFKALAPYVAGFSDDGRGVQRENLMRQAMTECKKVGKAIVAHCEADDLLQGGYIHDGEYARANGHKGICSESEWLQVKRDLELVRQTGCRYHVCHISTRESVELIRRAKAQGLPVTCETAPHYLLLNDMDLQENGSFKMNPPLRSVEDQAALIDGIVDGTIDCIATDHAPHSVEEKSRGLKDSAFGIVGLETAFPLLFTNLVKTNVISMEKLVDLMSTTPRHIMGLDPVRTGSSADLAVFNLYADYRINPELFVSKGRATPFAGYRVQSECVMTILRGEVVYRKI
ncbi:MAG: dihydroorotase [Candidatus Aphodosoma sp.]